jgi:hypothetical protein
MLRVVEKLPREGHEEKLECNFFIKINFFFKYSLKLTYQKTVFEELKK